MKFFVLLFLLIAQIASAQGLRLGGQDDSQNYCADAGANDTYACNLPLAPSAYTTGMRYHFKANTANTGAATINFNGLGAKTIKKAAGGVTTDLANNDIRAGQIVELVYDGTNMQMQSLLGNAPAGGGSTIYSARVTRTAVQSISNNTVTAIAFDSETCSGCHDTTTLHDNSSDNSRITIPAAATCTAGGGAAFASNTGGNVRTLYIYLNGTDLLVYSQKEETGSTFPSGELMLTLSTVFHAAANDYIELKVNQDTGGNLNVNQASYTPIFWVHCVAD